MPNRPRTPVSPVASARKPNNSASSKVQDLQEAYAMGRQHSESWTQFDVAEAQLRPRAAWRAIGLADAVFSFEHNPLFAELIQEWEKGFEAAFDSVSPAESTAPAKESQVDAGANPYYSNHDRAPYELGICCNSCRPILAWLLPWN